MNDNNQFKDLTETEVELVKRFLYTQDKIYNLHQVMHDSEDKWFKLSLALNINLLEKHIKALDLAAHGGTYPYANLEEGLYALKYSNKLSFTN